MIKQNVYEAYRSSGDADGNGQTALAMIERGDNAGCMQQLEWMIESLNRSKMYAEMALAELKE